MEWLRRSVVGCRAERVAVRAERIGLSGWDGILRCAQDDRRGKAVRCGQWEFVGHELKVEGAELELARGCVVGQR